MKHHLHSFFNFSNLRHPLLLFMVFFIAFVIALFPVPWQGHMYRFTITLLFFLSLVTIEKHRKIFLIPVVLAIAIQWVAITFDFGYLEMVSKILNLVIFLYMTGYFIGEIFRAREVTAKVILEAIIGYLLLGIVFSILVAFLVQVNPAMYNFPPVAPGKADSHFNEYLYFGFVTLSTLGYGDILALHPVSRSLAILISVSGQLYLAIIIALLVGKYAIGKNSG